LCSLDYNALAYFWHGPRTRALLKEIIKHKTEEHDDEEHDDDDEDLGLGIRGSRAADR